MTTFYSNEMTDFRAKPAKMNRPGVWGGRARLYSWSFNTGSGLAINDVIELVRLPRNFVVLGIYLYSEAMAASAVANLGDAGSATRYGSQSVASAVQAWLTTVSAPVTITAANMEVVQATVAGAAWPANRNFRGAVFGYLD